jgi:hypothetical protein
MSFSADEYRTKLINKILLAASQEEVRACIDTAMKAFEHSEANRSSIPGFIEKIIHDLELFNPLKKEAQQWSNIKFARILFNRIRNTANAPISSMSVTES